MSADNQPPPSVSQSQTSMLAVWSLVLGILSVLTACLFLGIPAILCGRAALRTIGRSCGAVKGTGPAQAGQVMGYLSLLLTSVAFFGLIEGIRSAPAQSRRSFCMSNLGQIGMAGRMYSEDNAGAPFPDFKTLRDSGANTPKLFICKSSGHLPGDLANVDEWADYVLVPVGMRGTNDTDVVAFDKPENHKGRGGNVLHVDGSVAWLDTEEFNKTVAPFLKPSSGPSPGR